MVDFTNDTEELEALVEVRKRKRKRKIIYISIVATIIAITLGLVWFYGYNYANNKATAKIDALNSRIYELENEPVVLDPVTPEIVQKVLISKTSDISELASAEYIFTNAARFTDTAHIVKILDWMTKKSFVQKWDGKIKAGINVDELKVSIKDKTITITMPYPKILSYEIDYNSVEVLDEQNNIFNPITVDDKVNFDRETKFSMEARAVENGLLTRAEANAKSVIKNLLTASIDNIQDYKIVFKTVDN